MITDKFSGQVAIVTGAGQGIGFEIAKQLSTRRRCRVTERFERRTGNQAADAINSMGGITLFGDFLNYPAQSLQSVMNLNLQGSFLFGTKGSQQIAHQDLAAYGMTKAALEMLAKSLVVELSQHQITVNTVAPGATFNRAYPGRRRYQKTWARITPMGRPATVEDVANAVLFLVSPGARHITGQNLVVDGGWTAVSTSPY
ncbi:uncharacterized protein [Henckelia pumila]|uniref:uncharacterized protein n=1 Tax=Henckelia pumila TaxID=405737 RepID=UPI003C6E90B3